MVFQGFYWALLLFVFSLPYFSQKLLHVQLFSLNEVTFSGEVQLDSSLPWFPQILWNSSAEQLNKHNKNVMLRYPSPMEGASISLQTRDVSFLNCDAKIFFEPQAWPFFEGIESSQSRVLMKLLQGVSKDNQWFEEFFTHFKE
jgi:hypothetical protein